MQDGHQPVADGGDLGGAAAERAVELVVEEEVEAHEVGGQGEFVGPGVGVAEGGEVDDLPVRVRRVGRVGQQRVAGEPGAVQFGGVRPVGTATVRERNLK